MRKSAIHSPFALSDTERVGRRRFWKQVLPVTSIKYEGRRVKFDPNFHMDLSKSFKGHAFDQVPLVFADSGNGHNMDPRNYGGDIIDMEYRGPDKNQGTWALIEADREAARVIKRNPKLGVSARIRQAVEKADGRFFPRAVEHVLLTMNPRVTGMSPWQAVDLSEGTDIEVVDLTAAQYKEGTEMGKTPKGRSQQSQTIDLSTLDDDEFKALLIDLTTETAERGIDVNDLEDEDDEGEVETVATRRKRSRVKVTKTTERDSEVTPDDGDDDEGDDGDADLSDDDDGVIRRSEVSQFAQMRIDLAEQNWQRTRDAYLRDGVPAFFLDLAEPVLSQPDAITIDLSESGEDDIDVSATVLSMLEGLKKVVDLTGEIGTSIDLSDDDEAKSTDDALYDQWDKEYPA